MHHLPFYIILWLFAFSVSGQVATLPPDAFDEKLKFTPNAQLLDLRKGKEFGEGHLKKAKNFDYHAEGFESFVNNEFNRSQPLFIYCYTGVRSDDAKIYLNELGFGEVYVLEGGFVNWARNSKPYVTTRPLAAPSAFFTMKDLEREIYRNPVLLVDFYADWCGPCKKMKPILRKIEQENPGVKVIEVDADKSEDIVALFRVNEIPTLILFKEGKQVWRGAGLKTEREITKALQ